MSCYMNRERWIMFHSDSGRCALLPENTVRWLKVQSPVEQDEFLDYWFNYEAA